MNYEEVAEDVGHILFTKRKALKVSQAELSLKSGVSRASIVRIEAGEVSNPALNTLEKLANALGYEVIITFEPILEGEKWLKKMNCL